jgi:hypothetical protein
LIARDIDVGSEGDTTKTSSPVRIKAEQENERRRAIRREERSFNI